MRLVLDTNVLVSGLLFPGGPPSRLVKAWRSGAFDLVISDFVMHPLPPATPPTPPVVWRNGT